ncbi:MAG: hypothetical protein ACTSUX_03960 [Promethearchaeota archaeon]
MSKGVFLRLSDEVYNFFKKEADKKGTRVSSLIKSILSEYAKGRLKIITPEEEALLKSQMEIIPIKDKVEKLDSQINIIEPRLSEIDRTVRDMQNSMLAFKQIIDHVMILEQRLNSIERRLKNLEKR